MAYSLVSMCLKPAELLLLLLCPTGRSGFDQDSMFALLEHADEAGRVPSSPGSGSSSRPAAQAQTSSKGNQAAKKQPLKQTQTVGRPPGAPAQTARAEDYYRAFEHVFRDPSSGAARAVHNFHMSCSYSVLAPVLAAAGE